MAAASRRPRARGTLTVPALVLRRSDFRESSRIVTVVTREHGRLSGLAKGAHRSDSPFLGRIDFLNEVVATFSPERTGLRLLERAELVRERRALRDSRRFLAASHLAQLADYTLPDERPDPAAFDLLQGGLNLVERCPLSSLGTVVLGLELRHLALLGALPDLDRCSSCAAELGTTAFRVDGSPGLACRACAGPGRHAIGSAVLERLRALATQNGRSWPDLPTTVPAAVVAPLPAAWLSAATEQRPRLRALLFASL